MKVFLKKSYQKLKANTINPVKYAHIKRQMNCKHDWYGNQYGGFYINPDLLSQGGKVISIGIGEDISFDKAMIDAHNCSVFGFDPTPKSIDWCANQQLPNNFTFYPYGVAKETGTALFNLPVNPDHVSGSVVDHKQVANSNQVEVEMKSFRDILQLINCAKIDVLKMDIEGSEYEVMEAVLESDIEITQMVIEFHERFFPDGKEKTTQVIAAMNAKGYQIFGISDSYEEISFVKTAAL